MLYSDFLKFKERFNALESISKGSPVVISDVVRESDYFVSFRIVPDSCPVKGFSSYTLRWLMPLLDVFCVSYRIISIFNRPIVDCK